MAEFRRFDPEQWEPVGEPGGAAKAAKPAKVEEPAFATLATLATLPDDLVDGLKRLSRLATPRIANPRLWTAAVADAQRIASEGWAYQALSLGWTALDLFGAIPDKGGDPLGDGLAVWLSGRKVLALSAEGAAVLNGKAGRSYFLRPRAPGARLLWELGCGR